MAGEGSKSALLPELAAGDASQTAGVTCQVVPLDPSSSAKVAQPATLGAADPRMVEAGASAASPPSEAADSRGQPSGPAQPAAVDSNGTTAPDPAKPPDESTLPLENFLTSMGKLDDLKFFSEPVRDEDAPGYLSVITHPMDLQTMSQKVCLL